MNGTDLAAVNVYGFSGEPLRQSVGVYSYPKNLGEITQRMKHVEAYRDELVVTMAEQGFTLSPEDSLVPIYIHRYVVCTSDPASSVVYRSTMATTRSSTETRYKNTWKGSF